MKPEPNPSPKKSGPIHLYHKISYNSKSFMVQAPKLVKNKYRNLYYRKSVNINPAQDIFLSQIRENYRKKKTDILQFLTAKNLHRKTEFEMRWRNWIYWCWSCLVLSSPFNGNIFNLLLKLWTFVLYCMLRVFWNFLLKSITTKSAHQFYSVTITSTLHDKKLQEYLTV
jgi:hypothetical protein